MNNKPLLPEVNFEQLKGIASNTTSFINVSISSLFLSNLVINDDIETYNLRDVYSTIHSYIYGIMNKNLSKLTEHQLLGMLDMTEFFYASSVESDDKQSTVQISIREKVIINGEEKAVTKENFHQLRSEVIDSLGLSLTYKSYIQVIRWKAFEEDLLRFFNEVVVNYILNDIKEQLKDVIV